jgi:hypothetical protein
VVKVIDVYPDEMATKKEMGGFQLPIAMDIFRGRYRNLRQARADPGEQGAGIQVPPADGEPRLPARAQDHGAGPVEPVPGL